LAPVRPTQDVKQAPDNVPPTGPRFPARPWLLGLAWAAGLLLAVLGGYAVAWALCPWQPGEAELVHELRLIDHLHQYEQVEDVELLKELNQPDLFGEEALGP